MQDLATIVAASAELAPLPQAYLRLRELLACPAANMGEVARVISADPGLTARLLRLANSPWFGCRARVETIHHAVHLLGTSEIHRLALAGAAISAVNRLGTGSDMRLFWRLSVHCAVLARGIAARHLPAHTETAFVAGLLHAIGHLPLHQGFPEQMQDLRAAANAAGKPLFVLERAHFGFDYASVGAALLEHWQLPARLCAAVGGHLSPTTATTALLDASIVHIASVLALGTQWRAGEADTVPDIEPVALQTAGLVEDDIEALLRDADAGLLEALALIAPQARAGLPAPAGAAA